MFQCCGFAAAICFTQKPSLERLGERKIRCHFKADLPQKVAQSHPVSPSKKEALHIKRHRKHLLLCAKRKRSFPIHAFSVKKLVLKAVDDVSFALEEGKTLGLIGESGCGKTSLAKAILQINPITSGDVLLEKSY